MSISSLSASGQRHFKLTWWLSCSLASHSLQGELGTGRILLTRGSKDAHFDSGGVHFYCETREQEEIQLLKKQERFCFPFMTWDLWLPSSLIPQIFPSDEETVRMQLQMLFSLLIDFSVSYASQSKEWLICKSSIEPVRFPWDAFLEGWVLISSLPSQVWGKDGHECYQRLGLEPAPEPELLPGAWISCVPPGHRGMRSGSRGEARLKCARGTREDTVQGCSDQGKPSSTWAPHVRHKYSSLVSAQLGRALFSFRKECCQFVFGWQMFVLFKKQKGKKKNVLFCRSLLPPTPPSKQRANDSH